MKILNINKFEEIKIDNSNLGRGCQSLIYLHDTVKIIKRKFLNKENQ